MLQLCIQFLPHIVRQQPDLSSKYQVGLQFMSGPSRNQQEAPELQVALPATAFGDIRAD